MKEMTPQNIALKMLIVGAILILVRKFYPLWDIWIVIGALFILKAIIIYVKPEMMGMKKRRR